MSQNLDKTIRLQSEKRQEWIREMKETTRNCRGREQRSPSDKLSAALFPGRNECPGTHCNLMEQEERRQFLPDVPERFTRKDGGEDRTRVR